MFTQRTPHLQPLQATKNSYTKQPARWKIKLFKIDAVREKES